MTSNSIQLSLKEKVGYAVGDTASNLFFQTFMLFLMIFYTDVFGIPAATVGTMMLITRLWDAINDPIMGMLADRTNTRWGKFRPFLLWLALPFGLFGVLMFTTPDLSMGGKIVYAYVTYTLMMMVYTAINVPYSALMGVITPNAAQRTVLSSFRFVAAFVGAIIVQSTVMRLVRVFGKGDEALGWTWAMGMLSALAVLLFIVTYATTKERVHPPKNQSSNFKRDLLDLMSNAPWLMVALATVFQLTYIVIRNAAIAYYFKYYVMEQTLTLFGKSWPLSIEAFTTSFMMTGTVFTILGAVLTKWISAWIGKKNTYAGFMAASAILNILFFICQPQNVLLIYVMNIIISFLMGPMAVLQWAMYTDTADYGEWKNGRRATGLVMSASLFALKLGATLGGAIVGWGLSGFGYVANEAQSAGALMGIRLLMTVFPGIAGLLGAASMIGYPLNNQMMVKIETELKARREKE